MIVFRASTYVNLLFQSCALSPRKQEHYVLRVNTPKYSSQVQRQKSIFFYQPCWLKGRLRHCQIFSSGFSLINLQIAPPCCLFTWPLFVSVSFCVLTSSCKGLSQKGSVPSLVVIFVSLFKTITC